MVIHPPVMVGEVMGVLEPGPGGVYVDATVGLGGHAEQILKLVGPEGRLIGIDRDDEALKMAEERLRDTRVVLAKGRFSDLEDVLGQKGVREADGILFDFGVSMLQFKAPGRGFSFNSDEPLDMRMDRSQRLSAAEVVNTYPERELEKILREYGEERLAPKIARAIGARRAGKKISTCRELAEIISSVYRGRGRHHPATRTFQALRIEVNDELGEIRKGLGAAVRILRSGGRFCAISYHSLEDREVKNFIRSADREGLVRTLTRKPLVPSRDEVRQNPSARSAKLRGAERL